MLLLLSPAKSLDFSDSMSLGPTSQPALGTEALKVMEVLANKGPQELQKLQSISEKLAKLNFDRNQQWQFPAQEPSRQAVLAFTGDVYKGLAAHEWTEEDMEFAQEHLRILSGLYGLLKPGDLIMPYRLEMGTKISVARSASLYDFWEKPLQALLKQQIKPDTAIVNLASNEYFKAWQKAGLKNKVLKPEFKDKSRGKYKVISFYAKQARGLMAKYIIQHRIKELESLKDFNLGGYYFSAQESTDDTWVFLRDSAQ